MTYTLIIALSVALFCSLLWGLDSRLAWRKNAQYWERHAQDAEDRVHAAELRSAQQIDAMLDRVVTSERLELHEAAPPSSEPEDRPYISDFPYEDERWNDLRESAVKEPAE